MPGLHTEKRLQNEMTRELVARGWVEGTGRKGQETYDLKRALYSEDVLAWIRTTEPTAYAKIQATYNGDTDEKILLRLADVIEKRGIINVLRKGFDMVPTHFSMFAPCPNSKLNRSEADRYKANILRVVPELEYSEHNGNRLDFGFFVNGLAVATGEMKTENTQTIDDAVRQYCEDRPSKDLKTKKAEPLLTWKRGAIVHFAIGSREVRMTTKLAGRRTVFLPFNRGHDGGAGNPPESGVNYLWEQILERHAWLDILANFFCIDKREKLEDGKKEIKETLLFPRYHQWDAVSKLIAATRLEGPGSRYLIQHSAGSGKSNTIMWLAHRLANLHDDHDKKVFSTTFVVTDRTNLDDQLAQTVKQFADTPGLIARIDGSGASKSDQLAKAIAEKSPIAIVTLQTFPFVLERLRDSKEYQSQNFAIIADEAHSSQTGSTAVKVRELLGLRDDEGEVGTDDVLAADLAAPARPKNLSYYAFTATPKKRTIELFGRPGPDGKPVAFNTYTMRQAIEEGFILDVLQHYITYEMAFKLATSTGDLDVPKSDTAKLIIKMVKLHPSAIGQKIAIIVTHFRESVTSELSGRAKAMIVTDSREAAVRYKRQLDRYLTEEKITDLKAIVAFSGDVPIDGLPTPFNEANMNGLRGVNIPDAFDTAEYQVLIVADKFQTGFDQPLLFAMYVDKKLDGLAAVQTLSRLNRTYHGAFGEKERVFILDFVNEADSIRDAFLPYYDAAEIDAPSDPNAVPDLRDKIDDYGMPALYAETDVDAFAAELALQQAKPKADREQTPLNNLIAPVAWRYSTRLKGARDRADFKAVDAAQIFRKDLGSFVRLYRFLSQIYDFENAEIAKREAFYEWLARIIREQQTGERPDISGVSLIGLGMNRTSEGRIALDGKALISGGDSVGSRIAKVKEYGPLQEVIDLMNEFFGATTSEESRLVLLAGIFEKISKNPTIEAQAKNNSPEKFALGSVHDHLKTDLAETYIEEVDKHAESTRQMEEMHAVLSEKGKFEQFAQAMASAVYKHFNQPPAESGLSV